jgi:ABC-type multidrug transport system fused ATPase/permease subunit
VNSGTTRRLWQLLTRDPWLLAGMLVSGVVSVALTAAGPWLLGQATNLVVAGVAAHRLDFPAIGRVLLATTGSYAGAGLCAVIQGRLANTAVQRVLATLRDRVETKIARLPLGYFDSQHRGEILSRVTNDIDNLGTALQQAFGQFVIPLLSIAGMLAVMFSISWPLALIALVTAPVSILVAAWIGKRAQPGFRTQWRHTGRLNAHVEEMITGHVLVKAFGRERQAMADFAEHNAHVTRATFAAQSRANTLQPAMTFLANTHYILIAVVGGLRVVAGALTVGDVQAFIQYSRQYSQPFSYLASMIGMVQSGAASADRVFDFLDAAEQSADPVDTGPVGPVDGQVEFERVRFRYQPEKPLIENLSLMVEPGHTVAIVGPTGAGKTTLVNLLMRFYELDEGRIVLDGVDIATMSRARLRSRVGMVLQDTWLFRGTIAENIAYGAENATRDQIVAAATAAHADWFIRSLPDGYDTLVDDDGAALSAGEKQLLTIARAFLADPTILVLDEATSSVDTRTEALVQQAMSRLRQGRTAFVIAHRLSTIRDADTIIVMAQGAIAEQGIHDQLLAAGGIYAELYQAQFAVDHEGIAR